MYHMLETNKKLQIGVHDKDNFLSIIKGRTILNYYHAIVFKNLSQKNALCSIFLLLMVVW